MGKRQQSKLIGVALEIELRGVMNRFDIGRCHSMQGDGIAFLVYRLSGR